jgi:hypothetical protein
MEADTKIVRMVWLVLLALLLAGCQVVVIPVPVPVAPPVATSAPAATVAAMANDGDVLTQFDAITAACNPDTTMAQQRKALDAVRPMFAGRQVELAGTVVNVRDLSGMYDAIVTLEGTSRDVRITNLSEEQALALNKGQPVVLVGEIDVSGCTAYVQIVGTISPR